MFNNIIKNLGTLLISAISSDRFQKRCKDNLQVILQDDQVIEEVLVGFDDNQLVLITATNKGLLVVGDTIIHSLNKDDIIDIDLTNGILLKLVTVQTVNETVYFKVFSKKAINKLKYWLK